VIYTMLPVMRKIWKGLIHVIRMKFLVMRRIWEGSIHVIRMKFLVIREILESLMRRI